MYINIKLPPELGALKHLQKENYPFNTLFTSFLSEVSKLGIAKGLDVEELVGYIEDRAFDGQRLPDIPEGSIPVNIRFKTEDPYVVHYIGESELTNRRAVLYIIRMMLRMSSYYGTSLLRLTRVVRDLNGCPEPVKETVVPEKPKRTPKPKKETAVSEEDQVMPAVRLRGRVSEPVKEPSPKPAATAAESAQKAKAALSELENLTRAVGESDVVETNPFLSQFGGI